MIEKETLQENPLKGGSRLDQILLYWLLFLISALFIILSGTRLSIIADEIAAKTGLGRVFLGSILLAIATSLPEMVTIGSASLLEAPDIGIGNIFGSYSTNFLILVLIDLFHGRGPLMLDTGLENLLLAFFGILLSSTAIFFIILYTLSILNTSTFIGFETPIILLCYLSSSRLIYRYQKKNKKSIEEEAPIMTSNGPLARLYLHFALATLVIFVSGVTIAKTGEVIAETTGLGQSLVGTLFIGISTSLPELITTLTAVKIAAYDLAVGNILGSNIINITLIIVADLLYKPGPILESVSIIHAGTASLGIILTIIASIGLFYRSQKTILLFLGWDTASIFVLYCIGIYFLFF